jgi:hypothetical protein
MKAKCQSTVELVFGTLTQFMGMCNLNTIVRNASQQMYDDGWHCLQSQEIPKIYSKTAKK